jgi:predicted dehydrogenase
MVSETPLRVGLLGFGLAGSVFHAPLIAACPGLTLAAVVTTSPERQALAKDRHDGVAVLATADQLWDRADQLDLIVVATSNRSHVELTSAAIDHGLAVVVDKPFAPTAAKAQALVDRAGANQVPLSVFQNRRWDGDFLTVRALVEAGDLGVVHRFESRFERWVPTPKPGWRESGDPEEAGGLLFDLGSHVIDQALVLFGAVDQVYCERENRRTAVAVDDDTFIALTHGSGVRTHLWMSKLAAQAGPRFRVLGDRAGFLKNGLDQQEPQLRDGSHPGDPDFGHDPQTLWGYLGTDPAGTRVPTLPGAYLDFYRGMEAAVRDGKPVPVDPLDCVNGLRIIEAAAVSAATCSVVPLADRP